MLRILDYAEDIPGHRMAWIVLRFYLGVKWLGSSIGEGIWPRTMDTIEGCAEDLPGRRMAWIVLKFYLGVE